MAIIGLNLPTDVPWERTCVTQDMMAHSACELQHPPKWQSSIAVSQYVPQPEYQVYPSRKITYLKITCSITGYQPRDKEIEGRINFGGMSVLTIDNVDSLLEQYLPCTGALIQVAISPHTTLSGAPGASLDNYPYFMDFQPKKRELYEMVTETGERSSRSAEDLKIGKAAGNSQSLEVLDVDQGSSSGGSAGVSYAGVGVTGSYQSASQGQWGTKQLSNQEGSVSRATDESRERRETDSHTTQLSQMYHLLDSYHMGTNRALFFVQPRPHILEVPTGFVRGPRGVDGIQEFFLIVNQPKDQDGFEVSVRLDTSHLTTIPIMGYDRSRTDTVICKAIADFPTSGDTPDARQTLGLQDGDGDRVGTAYYNCFKKDAHSSTPYTPPSGYLIDVANNGGYLDQVISQYHGSSSVNVDPSGNSLTVTCDAESHVCKFEHSDIDVGYNDPDNIGNDTFKWNASAERDILVYLISREPTIKTGDKHVLVITTRELCCGGRSRSIPFGNVADVIGLTGRDGKSLSMASRNYIAANVVGKSATVRASDGLSAPVMSRTAGITRTASWNDATDASCVPALHPSSGQAAAPADRLVATRAAQRGHPSAADPLVMTAREANDLSGAIKDAMILSAGSRKRDVSAPLAYIDTDLFHNQLKRQHLQSGPGRAILNRSIVELVGPDQLRRMERLLALPAAEITCGKVADRPSEDLASGLAVDLQTARRLKLECLGLVLHYADPDLAADDQ